MVTHCPPITAHPFACASRASSATRTRNISLGSFSPTAWIALASAPARAAPKAATPGMAAFDCALRHLRALQIGADRERTGVTLLHIRHRSIKIALRDVAEDQAARG